MMKKVLTLTLFFLRLRFAAAEKNENGVIAPAPNSGIRILVSPRIEFFEYLNENGLALFVVFVG